MIPTYAAYVAASLFLLSYAISQIDSYRIPGGDPDGARAQEAPPLVSLQEQQQQQAKLHMDSQEARGPATDGTERWALSFSRDAAILEKAENVMLVPCTANQARSHFEAYTDGWWKAVAAARLVVVYVIGSSPERRVACSGREDRPACLFYLREQERRPPVEKEVRMMMEIPRVAHAARYVVKSDADTLLFPERLAAAMTASRSTKDDVFMGRPVGGCMCRLGVPEGRPCASLNDTISYCSGWLYVTTMSTLRRVVSHALRFYSTKAKVCRSSDVAAGVIMNAAGVRCSPLLLGGVPGPPSGNSRSPPDPEIRGSGPGSERVMLKSHLCQQNGVAGGVQEDFTVSDASKYHPADWDRCAGMHPFKDNLAEHAARFYPTPTSSR